MNWYYNNQGIADGPYDEPEMRAHVKRGLISAKTLVWQSSSMEVWQEAAPLNPTWWQPLSELKSSTRPSVTPKPQAGAVTINVRHPIPHAPMETPKPSKVGGFIKKLFGRADKEA